jgi:hypothetical protein
MNSGEAARTLEVIRTLMERTCQYQLLTARAGLAAGSLAALGSLAFLVLDEADPVAFGAVWGVVFAGSLAATMIGTVCRGRERGEKVWSRQARAVLAALMPALFCAAALTGFFFAHGLHLWLPGVWMLCYGQGALATSAYAPPSIRWLGLVYLGLGAVTLALGPLAAATMMGLSFGGGHLALGLVLMRDERAQAGLRLHREVA